MTNTVFDGDEVLRTESFSLSDSVLHKLVQLLQLAMVTGTDVADHMRAIRLRPSADMLSTLELTDEYNVAFKAGLEQLQARADEIIKHAQSSTSDGDHFVPDRGPSLVFGS